eukprot:8996970-Pyramimonas_sp.AAC.1
MRLSLARIGCKAVTPLTFGDDYGRAVHLGYSSPAMLAHMLQLAVQRTHERVSCQDTPGADGS